MHQQEISEVTQVKRSYKISLDNWFKLNRIKRNTRNIIKMEAVAKLNNYPTSPRKMRLLADLIRGMEVEKALGNFAIQS